jgi:hypothetical protein
MASISAIEEIFAILAKVAKTPSVRCIILRLSATMVLLGPTVVLFMVSYGA